MEAAMLYRSLIGAIVLAAMAMPARDVLASEDAKYPDWSGQGSGSSFAGFPASRLTTRPSRGDWDNERR
jgi:hypothetical protein